MTQRHGWQVIGKTIRGASHKRAGLPNQDYIDWWPKSEENLPVVLVVSDGHGNAHSFRSAIGSQLAVTTAIEVIKRFIEYNYHDPSVIYHKAKEELPKALIQSWRKSVSNHIKKNRHLTDKERERLSKQAPQMLKNWQKNPDILAYGATLLCVIATEPFIIYLQLGDGDILTVSEYGKVTRPLPSDKRLIANETTSLSSSNAWQDVRVVLKDTSEAVPALILVSTDGYANSFRNDAEFLKIGPDLLQLITEDGIDEVSENLERWLNEASSAGSGDDITLGIISRPPEATVSSVFPPSSAVSQVEDTHKIVQPKIEGTARKRPSTTPIDISSDKTQLDTFKENSTKTPEDLPKIQKNLSINNLLIIALIISNVIVWPVLIFLLIFIVGPDDLPFNPTPTQTAMPTPSITITRPTENQDGTGESVSPNTSETQKAPDKKDSLPLTPTQTAETATPTKPPDEINTSSTFELPAVRGSIEETTTLTPTNTLTPTQTQIITEPTRMTEPASPTPDGQTETESQ